MGGDAISEQASDRAIEWFVRLRAEDVTQTEREAFFTWLRVSREHQQAFIETLQLWQDAAIVKTMNFEELANVPELWTFKKKLESSLVGNG